MVKGIWHFSFTVSDLERSVKFYCDLLGMVLQHRQEQDNPYTRKLVGYPEAHLRLAQLTLPQHEFEPSGHVLELVQYLSPRFASHPAGTAFPNSAHLAFVVGDLHEEFRHLTRAGVHFLSEPVAITAGINQGGYSVYFRDPDGITLEMVQPPERKARK